MIIFTIIKQWVVEQIATSKPFRAFYDDVLRQASIDAFKKAHADIMETMHIDIDKKAKELMEREFERLMTSIDSRLIVSATDKAIYIGGVKADPSQLKNLKSEADFFAESDLWKLLHETPKKLAHLSMFSDDGKLDANLIKGRAILYTLDTQSRILSTFKAVVH